jgi:hypothetical protein
MRSSAMATYLEEMFDADTVKKQGIVRRSKMNIERFSSLRELVARVRKEQFHLIETGDQYIVICNPGALTIHC